MSTKLVEAFIATELPVGHLDAFKEGAAYGYLLAKRQMVEAIDNRLEAILQAPVYNEDKASAKDLIDLRNFVRHVMLFKKE